MSTTKQSRASSATLSRRILQALLDRGLTQSAIAEMVVANRSHITRVKSGEHEFTDVQLEKIEKVTRTPLGLLLIGAEPPRTAGADVRRLHKEARQLVMQSAEVRKKLRAS